MRRVDVVKRREGGDGAVHRRVGVRHEAAAAGEEPQRRRATDEDAAGCVAWGVCLLGVGFQVFVARSWLKPRRACCKAAQVALGGSLRTHSRLCAALTCRARSLPPSPPPSPSVEGAVGRKRGGANVRSGALPAACIFYCCPRRQVQERRGAGTRSGASPAGLTGGDKREQCSTLMTTPAAATAVGAATAVPNSASGATCLRPTPTHPF